MMNGNEHHESEHEYNQFLDREIQKKLLSIEDDDDDDDLQRSTVGEYLSACVARGQLGRAKNTGSKSAKAYEHFDAWCPESSRKQRKSERQQKVALLPKWELIAGKDYYKQKDIGYSFRHYSDWRKYMEQYRKEHTYNFGPLEGKDFEVPTHKLYPSLDKCRQQNRSTPPPSSAKSTTRTFSDTNLLELASKCKLNQTLAARCHSGDLAKRESCATCKIELKPESAPEAQGIQKGDVGVSRSQHNVSGAGKVGGKGLAPLSGMSPKVSSLTASSASAMKITAIGTAPKRLDCITQNGANNNKKGKNFTSNGYLLDKTISSRCVNNKSPPLLLPNSQLRTLDLLCNVSTIHKQKLEADCCEVTDMDEDEVNIEGANPPDGAATTCPIDEETEGEMDVANIVPNGEVNKTDKHEKNGRLGEALVPCQTLEALDGDSNQHVDGYNIVSVDPTFPGNLDQVSILRRYMMDLAEFEDDFELRDRLGSAPDVAFRNSGQKMNRRETVQKRLTLKSAMLTQYRSAITSARRRSVTNGKTDLSQLPLTKSGRAHTYFHKRTILSAATQTATTNLLHDHRFHNPLELPSMQQQQQQQQQHAKKSTSSKTSADKAGYSVIQGLNHGAHNKALWFDASGRAYVSLATRYDPVHK